MTLFKNLNTPPVGGYFYELNGEKATGRFFCEIEPKVRSLLNKYHMTLTVHEALAAYMCPRIPEAGWLCTGGTYESKIRAAEAFNNSVDIVAGRDAVLFDDVERRLRICMKCPMHTREFCVTCTGHLTRLLGQYLNRPEVPEDAGTGICKCARAYESAIASVEYGRNEPIWDNVPDTCWRKTDEL